MPEKSGEALPKEEKPNEPAGFACGEDSGGGRGRDGVKEGAIGSAEAPLRADCADRADRADRADLADCAGCADRADCADRVDHADCANCADAVLPASVKPAHLAEAAAALGRGEAVVFPTDTVLGLGVSVESAANPHLLFDIKRRDEGKPVAWLVSGTDDLRRYGAAVPELAVELAKRYWPGPLTLVVRASEAVPTAFRGANGSIGLRMPNHPAALALVQAAGCPLATTSANIAGEPAPARFEDLDPRIAAKAGCVFAGRGSSAGEEILGDGRLSTEDSSPISGSALVPDPVSAASAEGVDEGGKKPDCDCPTVSAAFSEGVGEEALAEGEPPCALPAAAASRASGASGEASTVVDFTGASPRILREGAVKMSDIENLAEELASREAGPGAAPEAPAAWSEVVREEASFPSADGASTIHARWWLPACALRPAQAPRLDQPTESDQPAPSTQPAESTPPIQPAETQAPRAVVQLVHGMAEHIGRYDQFAAFLAEAGFAVCGHDHIGHGASASSPADWGCLPPKTGADVMVEDAHRMRQLAATRFPGVPHVIFGHSMGSFVVRSYVARHGAGLAGAVVCGTGNQALLLSKSGNALANLLCALRGPRFVSGLLHNMAVGAYGKAVKNARTPDDWICTDPAVVDAYAADSACGYRFSAGGYAALTSLTAEVVTEACAARIPKDLSVLFIAGAEDPVGDFGRGVEAAADLVKKAGVADVTTVIYEGMRHEVLNERGRERVWADVAEWMEKHALP